MNLTRQELEDLLYNISEIITYIENSKYEKRRYKMYLSNGDHINFSVPNESIPHLLGINIPYLSSTRIFGSYNAFDLLKKLVSNSDKVWNLYKKGIISFNQLFSPFIFEKVDNFRENITIMVNEVEFICKYNPERSFINSDDFEKCDYLMLKKLSNGKYGLLTLVRNEGYFTPMSNQIFDDYESAKTNLKSKLKHQDITLMSGIKIYFNNDNFYYDDEVKNIYLNFSEKKQKLYNLIQYKNDLDCSTDVASDFIYSIGRLNQNVNSQTEMNFTSEKIAALIEKGEIIDISYIEPTLKPIVDAYNNIVCSLASSGKNSKTYTEIKEELKELKSALTRETEVSKAKEKENTTLKEENKTLSEENFELKDKVEKIKKLLK